MKKFFLSILSLCLSFFFFSCNVFSTNDDCSSIVVNFGSVKNSRAVSYTLDYLSYCVVSIEPKVQDDILVNFADGETEAVFSNIVSGTYKINVSAFNENNIKIAYGESEQVDVIPIKSNSVRIKMQILSPDYSTCVVGDFILKDGSILSKNKTPKSDTVAAVIVRAASGENPALGVGIVHNKQGLAWCTEDAAGYSINIEGLQGTTTGGYTDGSDGWEILKDACPNAEENHDNYPAWNYSLTYAATNGLTGDLEEGWYFPTAAELYTIYESIETIDASLEKAGKDMFDGDYYLSCSQNPTEPTNGIALNFYSCEVTDSVEREDDDYYVCTVRAFN